MSTPNSVTNDLSDFFEFLYGGLEGYIYMAARVPGSKDTKDWLQEFFHWPTEATKAAEVIKAATNKFEIYVAPALYKEQSGSRDKWHANRENFLASNVVWTEFDGNAPADWNDTHGEPSLIIRSSEETRQHVYWRLTSPITSVSQIEDINRRITYNLGADSSAWDATQILRPPGTRNHKRDATVSVIRYIDTTYDADVFNSLNPAPEQIDTSDWKLSKLPNLQDVIYSYSFPPDLIQLLTKNKEQVKDRSAALMQLAYGCAQMGMRDNEIFVLLLAMDDTLEKFKGRKDREKRLAHIITVAKNKYPEPEDSDENFMIAFDYQSFMDTEIEIDWAIEPMLMEGGSMLMVGPGGIGKTQIALQVMIHLALGKNWLHYKIPEAKKVVFLSLEMGHGELKVFLNQMDEALTPTERAMLAENFTIIPLGEPLAINTPEGQQYVTQIIETFEPYGVFIDSIGSSIVGNISSDDVIQPLINFNDRVRNKYGCFMWYIHHMRKSQPGHNGHHDQNDVYGNQYLFNRATSCYAYVHGKDKTIRTINLKNRLADKEETYYIRRTEHLQFEKTTAAVDKIIEQLATKPDDEPKAGNFTL